MPKSPNQTLHDKFVGLLIVGYIVCVMAGMFIGMQIEKRMNETRNAITSSR